MRSPRHVCLAPPDDVVLPEHQVIETTCCRNENTNGLCSQCFKKGMSKMMMDKETESFIEKASSALSKEAPVDSAMRFVPPAPEEPLCAPSPSVVAEPTPDGSDPPAEPPRKKSRCAQCRRKVGLLGFECKCGKLLCTAHRQAEEHQCDFDHRQAGRAKLAEDNPLVSCSKVQIL